jgi:hypothetical protein
VATSTSDIVYVYEKPTTGWTDMTETARLTDSQGSSAHYLGQSVNIYEDIIVAGSRSSDYVYVYEKSTGGWTDMTETAQLSTSDNASGYAQSVAISGDVILAGAKNDDAPGSYSGSAYLFEKPLTGWATATES